MKNHVNRRRFIGAAGAAATTVLAATAAKATEEAPKSKPLRILGISCSARKGMTTCKAVQVALDAAKSVDARIEIELIDLGGLVITGWMPQPVEDEFSPILPKLQDPTMAGLIIGSPSYFRSPTSQCKAFIERCAPLREPGTLAGKPVGVVAVGQFRNGGQELVIEHIQTCMLCFGMMPVGGKAPAFQGATLLSTNDDISTDELGLLTAKQLGINVGKSALRLAGGNPQVKP